MVLCGRSVSDTGIRETACEGEDCALRLIIWNQSSKSISLTIRIHYSSHWNRNREMEKENSAKTDAELQKYKTSLSAKAKEQLVMETKELVEHQKREDTPEALATIPLLERKDISPKAQWYDVQEQHIADVPMLYHEEFTNGVVYSRMLFDMRTLPAELIPYAALLSEVLGSQNTEHYSYGDLDVALNIHTGGFNTLSHHLPGESKRYIDGTEVCGQCEGYK